jgi:4'-phosphopantetheinyl transferase
MTEVFYDKIPDQFDWGDYTALLRSLPVEIQEKIRSYRKKEDAIRALAGKLLLKKALEATGKADILLDDLRYDNYNRPFFNHFFDVNISHSGLYVVCALTDCKRVGIDIEKQVVVDTEILRPYLTPPEQQMFNKAESNKADLFFRLWTRKEAVVKADGRGLHFPLEKIDVCENQVIMDNKIWFLYEVNVADGYYSNLAIDTKLNINSNVISPIRINVMD